MSVEPLQKRKAAAWVLRLLENQGVCLAPEETYWWGWNLQTFLEYCRAHPLERSDLRVVAKAFLDSLNHAMGE
jgi:hypothetical protein